MVSQTWAMMRNAVRFTCLFLCLLFYSGCRSSNPWSGKLGRYEPEPVEKRSYRFLERKMRGLSAKSLEEIVSLPEEEIDVATGALLAAKEMDPTVDVKKYQDILDTMAKELAEYLKEPLTPEKVAEKFASYLFERKGFQVDITTFQSVNPQDLTTIPQDNLVKLLDSKKGFCASLSVLYLSLAERLGVPFVIVKIPQMRSDRLGHAFVKYMEGKIQFNIETSAKGSIVSDDFIVLRVVGGYPKRFSDILQRHLSKKQGIATVVVQELKNFCVNTRAIFWRERYSLLKKVTLLWPEDPELLTVTGGMYYAIGEKHEALSNLEKVYKLTNAFYIFYSLFHLYLAEEDYPKAVGVGERFLEKFPDHPDADKFRKILSAIAEGKTDGLQELLK